MSVKYKAIGRTQPGVTGGGNIKYYAAIVNQNERGIDKITTVVSEGSTVSGADIRAVIYGSMEAVTGFLSDGDIVRLGDFGTFRLSLSSAGEDAPEDVSVASIKGARIIFTPGATFKNMLKTLQFEKEKQPAGKPKPLTAAKTRTTAKK